MKKIFHIEQSDEKDSGVFASQAKLVGQGFQESFFPTIKIAITLIVIAIFILFVIF